MIAWQGFEPVRVEAAESNLFVRPGTQQPEPSQRKRDSPLWAGRVAQIIAARKTITKQPIAKNAKMILLISAIRRRQQHTSFATPSAPVHQPFMIQAMPTA